MLVSLVSASVVLAALVSEEAISNLEDGKQFFAFFASREEQKERLSAKEFHKNVSFDCGASHFTIKITYAGAGKETPYREYWGWDQFNKDFKAPFIIDINASRPDGKWYDIPQSAYADLSNPNVLSLAC